MATLVRQLLPLLLIASPLAAQIVEQGPPPRHVDRHGDPLPAGAVARFGSLRWRHLGLEDFAFLPDGNTIISVGGDLRIRRWEAETGRLIGRPLVLDADVRMLRLSADGSVAAGLVDQEVKIINPVTGRIGHSFKIDVRDDPLAMVVSPDGVRVAVWEEPGRVTIWDNLSKATTTIRLGGEVPRDVASSFRQLMFSPDGKRLIVWHSGFERIHVLDPVTGLEVFSRKCNCVGVDFLASGDRLAVGESGRPDGQGAWTLRVVDLKTGAAGKPVRMPKLSTPCWLTASPDGRRAVVCNYDSSCLAEVATGRVAQRFPGGETCRFSADGTKLAVRFGYRIFVRDIAANRVFGGTDEEVNWEDAVFSPDGRELAAVNQLTKTLETRDVRTARVVRRFGSSKDTFDARDDCQFADGGRTLRVCSGAEVCSWDLRTGKCSRVRLASVDSDETDARQSLFLDSATGRWTVVTGDRTGKSVRLSFCDATTGRLVSRRWIDSSGHGGSNHWIFGGEAFIRHDEVNSRRHEFALVDARTGRAAYQFPCDDDLKLSPDGRWIASFERSPPALRVWETSTGQETIPGTLRLISNRSIRMDIRERTLAVAEGKQFRVIDMATGNIRAKWELPDSGPANRGWPYSETVKILPDGRHVWTVLPDETALLWDISVLPWEPLSNTHGERDLSEWWVDLAGDDAKKAHAAVWKFAETPPELLMPFLRKNLRPATPPDLGGWRKLIADLDHPEFRVRAVAVRRLEAMGPAILDELKSELVPAKSPEVRERLEQLSAKFSKLIPQGETLRTLRALAVLESVKTVEARRLVEELSHGAASARETKAASDTLGRMPDPESWRK